MIPLESVDALDTLLGTAMRLIDELRNEGLLQRLIAVLGCMLPEDREKVLRVLEHDAETETRMGAGNLWARFAARPNPLAQLYARTGSTEVRIPRVRYLEIHRASSVGARLARSLPPWGEGGWEPETVETWRRQTPEVRAYLVGMSRRILATLEPNRRRLPHV